jgi:tetratricopeptide (TPR) repeat protein
LSTTELVQRLDEAFEKRAAGNYVEALEEFLSLEKLSTQSQDISALRLFQAYCLVDMGKIKEAYDRLNSVSADDLGDNLKAIYEYHLARALHALGRPTEALRHVEQSLSIFKSVSDDLMDHSVASDARTLLGLLLAECKRCEEALVLLKNITADDPAWAYVKLRIGDCLMEARQYRDAVECYISIVASDLEIDQAVRVDALRNLGISYFWMGDYDSSVKHLMRARDATNYIQN